MKIFNLSVWTLSFLLVGFAQGMEPRAGADVECESGVPVIYSSDLWSPHGDPDDHFDLASLFSLRNLDIKAVILDHTMQANVKRTGVEKEPNFMAVEKITALFNRNDVPAQEGLKSPLSSATDDGRTHPEEEQKAIELILEQLESIEDSRAVFITTGSLRDVCAAFNRSPDLFKKKAKAFYVSLGDSYGTTGTKDTNVAKDVEAWKGIMNSGLPVYWMPTNPSKRRGGVSRYVSHWHFVQSELLLEVPEKVRHFFLTEGIPVHAHPGLPTRSMWSTPGIIEAAGLNCYRVNGELQWMPGHEAREIPDAVQVQPYEFVPINFTIDEGGDITWEEVEEEEASSVRIFKMKDHFLYHEAMFQFLLKQMKSS